MKSEILRSFKTGMDMVLLCGSDEVFRDFAAELAPFTVEDFHQLKKYYGLMRITCDKKDHIFQAKLLEPASMRLPSYPLPDVGNRFGMTKEEIIRRARDILLPLYQREEKSIDEGQTAKDRILSLLKDHPEGLTRQQICDELGISRRTFQRARQEVTIYSRKEGNQILYFLPDKPKVRVV